jgi:hypothetical protein
MSANKETAQADRARKLRHLHELIAALDRRVPHVERIGERKIAREGRALRENAVQRIAELEASAETAPAATRRGRGPVDAPGKRHRKPPSQEPLNERMGEARGKQMGHKSAKTGWRGGRS